MKLISETINDIECKLDIFYSEKERLIKEKNKELEIDPYRLSAIDYSKPIVDSYKKYDIKIKDDKYIKKLEDRIEQLEKEISILENTKKKYISTLSKMDGIEYRLYAYILKGLNPTRAIEKVGEENFLNNIKPTTEAGIMPYYKNMKKLIQL